MAHGKTLQMRAIDTARRLREIQWVHQHGGGVLGAFEAPAPSTPYTSGRDRSLRGKARRHARRAARKAVKR